MIILCNYFLKDQSQCQSGDYEIEYEHEPGPDILGLIKQTALGKEIRWGLHQKVIVSVAKNTVASFSPTLYLSNIIRTFHSNYYILQHPVGYILTSRDLRGFGHLCLPRHIKWSSCEIRFKPTVYFAQDAQMRQCRHENCVIYRRLSETAEKSSNRRTVDWVEALQSLTIEQCL